MKPEANAKEVAKAVAKLQKYVDQVTDPKMRDEEDEIWAGVGFGPNFYKQVTVEESVYRCIYSVCKRVYSPYRCLYGVFICVNSPYRCVNSACICIYSP